MKFTIVFIFLITYSTISLSQWMYYSAVEGGIGNNFSKNINIGTDTTKSICN